MKILSLDEAKDENIDWPDLYFTPKYGMIVSDDTHIWECAISNDVFYVYLKKPIDLDGIIYYDLVSPYGYAGYYVMPGTSTNNIELFANWFENECHLRNYITEFVRFSPYLCTVEQFPNYGPMRMRSTYSIQIESYDQYFMTLSRNHRNMTKKGIKCGLQMTFTPVTVSDLSSGSTFRTLYANTMDRNSANEFYYFDDTYFTKLVELGNVYLATVYDKQNSIQTMSLFFVYKDMMHYHLSCRISKPVNCAQNFMFDQVVRWCLDNGIKLLHLGGGLKENDTLAKFKRKISNTDHDYYYGRRIINRVVYDRLCEIFPMYRV